MVDETGQVSEEILKQTQEILEFAAQKTGKENKEMAVTFVSNERSHELNLEYRDTDRPTDVISLEYKPELDIAVDEEDLLDHPELAEMLEDLTPILGNCSFQWTRRVSRLKNTATALSGRWAFWQYMVFCISTAMITIRRKKKQKCLVYRKKF